MRVLPTAAIALVFSLVSISSLDAQQSRRQGFWIGFGLGAGVNLSESLDNERQAGGSGFLRLGGTVSPSVLLGADFIGWVRDNDGSTLSRGTTTFAVVFYPTPTGGFFLKGGIGGSWVSVSSQILGVNVTATESGFGATAGLGFDVRISDGWSFTPAADLLIQAFDAGPNLSSTNSLLVFTVGFVHH